MSGTIAHTKGVTGILPISRKSWAGEVQTFTRPLPCGELRSRFVRLGDKEQKRKAGQFRSDDNGRIGNEVYQAALLLLVCNDNAGIQRAGGTIQRHSCADCGVPVRQHPAPWILTDSLNGLRGSAKAEGFWAFGRIAPPTKQPLHLALRMDIERTHFIIGARSSLQA